MTTKFVVDRSGAVSTTANDGSDITDADVIACVDRAVGNLTFPSLESGFALELAPTE